MRLSLCVIALLILIGCDAPTGADGKPLDYSGKHLPGEVIRTPTRLSSYLWVLDYEAGGMRYKIFWNEGHAVDVVNITLDSINYANLKEYSNHE